MKGEVGRWTTRTERRRVSSEQTRCDMFLQCTYFPNISICYVIYLTFTNHLLDNQPFHCKVTAREQIACTNSYNVRVFHLVKLDGICSTSVFFQLIECSLQTHLVDPFIHELQHHNVISNLQMQLSLINNENCIARVLFIVDCVLARNNNPFVCFCICFSNKTQSA